MYYLVSSIATDTRDAAGTALVPRSAVSSAADDWRRAERRPAAVCLTVHAHADSSRALDYGGLRLVYGSAALPGGTAKGRVGSSLAPRSCSCLVPALRSNESATAVFAFISRARRTVGTAPRPTRPGRIHASSTCHRFSLASRLASAIHSGS